MHQKFCCRLAASVIAMERGGVASHCGIVLLERFLPVGVWLLFSMAVEVDGCVLFFLCKIGIFCIFVR